VKELELLEYFNIKDLVRCEFKVCWVVPGCEPRRLFEHFFFILVIIIILCSKVNN
jgi:hypothetical protein